MFVHSTALSRGQCWVLGRRTKDLGNNRHHTAVVTTIFKFFEELIRPKLLTGFIPLNWQLLRSVKLERGRQKTFLSVAKRQIRLKPQASRKKGPQRSAMR